MKTFSFNIYAQFLSQFPNFVKIKNFYLTKWQRDNPSKKVTVEAVRTGLGRFMTDIDYMVKEKNFVA